MYDYRMYQKIYQTEFFITNKINPNFIALKKNKIKLIPNQTTSIKRKCSETVIVNMNSSYCITHLTNDIWFFLICVRIIMCSNPPNHHMSSNISGDHQILKIKNKIGFVCLQSKYLIFYLTFIDNQATKPSLLRVKFVEYHGFSNTPHVDTRVSS